MKREYVHPEVQTASFASMMLMQAASSAGEKLPFQNIESEQW